MNETTEGMSIGDALIAIGTWINSGIDVEMTAVENGPHQGYVPAMETEDEAIRPLDFIYRAKPAKPREGYAQYIFRKHAGIGEEARIAEKVYVIEATSEVRAVLEREGLL